MARGRKDYEKAVISVEAEGFVNPHGRILMHDNFEDTPMKWTAVGTGTWFVSRQARAAYNGSFGLELDVTATVLGVTDAVITYRDIPIDVTERLLKEIFWRANDLTRLLYLQFTFLYYDGVTRHYAWIRYNTTLGYWEYYTIGAVWAEIVGSDQAFFDGGWNEFTISCDFRTNEYVVFKSNNLEINMGGILCWSGLSGIGAHVRTEIHAANNTTDQLLVSIDDVIVRELEV